MDTQRDLMNVMYGTGYDDGVKAGKTEVLNELMKTILEFKASTESISCSTLMRLLQVRKNDIEIEQ